MSLNSERLTPLELRSGASLALIYAFRMFGIFLLLPVFALFAEDMPGSTPLLAGLALGIYGFTQALFQIPFGMLSDKIGRKPVIFMGLVIFAIGSLVASQADTIAGILIGRALQGAGAIASALMALAADLSREQHRTKMMAMIGSSIGTAFALSMVIAPVLGEWLGLSGIFITTAVLATCGIAVLFLLVPNPAKSHFHSDAELQTSSLGRVLKDADLLRLDVGIFILHFALMCVFQVMPLEIRDLAGLKLSQHWQIYLPVFVLSVILMVPFIIFAEKKHQLKPVFIGAITLLIGAIAGLYITSQFVVLLLVMILFFTAFNLLEAMLPSLVSKTAHAGTKGTAMGVYSSSQFLGTFCGGLAGGVAHQHGDISAVFLTALVAVVVWLVIAAFMSRPGNYTTYLLHVGELDEPSLSELATKLSEVAGVVETAIKKDEGVAYLRVEKHTLDEEKLLSFAVSED